MIRAWPIILLLAISANLAFGAERNPPPQFEESGHKLPLTTQPPPRADLLEWMDVAALVIALSAASYLALKSRSRRGLVILMLASLAYFGFYRKGCICAIGAIQNVTLSIFDSTYGVPLTAICFLALPLLFTLFFGRTFCASVCPLGAAQDVVTLKPVKIPYWLEHALGLLPFLYLGVAVFMAAMGSAFLICQYDPFVAFFRLNGSLEMLILGGLFLLIGVFVARPYCRYGCPLGAIFRLLSPLAWRHATITPDECIRCRLCEDACPFGAINKPTDAVPPRHRLAGKWSLAATLILLPILVAMGGWGVSRLTTPAVMTHPVFRLARQVEMEKDLAPNRISNEAKAFLRTGQPPEKLFAQATAIKNRFHAGLWWLGGFLGLVLGAKLVSLSVRRKRVDYTPDRARCVSCGRCFRYCPKEQVRLKKISGGIVGK